MICGCGKMWKTFTGLRDRGDATQQAQVTGDRTTAMTMRACSACAGDYEDPLRTTGPDEGDDECDASAYELEWEGDSEGDLDGGRGT